MSHFILFWCKLLFCWNFGVLLNNISCHICTLVEPQILLLVEQELPLQKWRIAWTAIASNKLWFSLTMLPFTHSFQRQMFFVSITFKMQFSCHQIFNWNLWYLKTFNDTHGWARHVTQHIELFANKFNLIFMEPWGGHSLHIWPSTSNKKIFFDMLRNNEK